MDIHGDVQGAIIFVCVCGLCTCAYVPKGMVQCLLYLGKVSRSNVLLPMFGMIDVLVGMVFSQKITNFIMLFLNESGTFLNGHGVTMIQICSFMTQIARSISGTCSPAAVQLRLHCSSFITCSFICLNLPSPIIYLTL